MQWLHRLFADDVVGIDAIEAMGLRHDSNDDIANQNGALRVRFRDGYRAIFKVCDAVPGGYSYESWKGEVIAHAIDRVFAINRAPAVVPRSIDVFDLKLNSTGGSSSAMSKNRETVSRLCQKSHKAFFGSLMGWTETNVEELQNYHIKYSARTVFNVSNMQQHNIEFARVCISLYLTGQPHKFNHNVFRVPSPVNNDLFLVSLDNDRAAWVPNEASEDAKFDPKWPACNRSPDHTTFHCHNFALGNTHQNLSKISMKHLESFFNTACIFPRTLSSRIRRFADEVESKDSKVARPSALVKAYVDDSLAHATRSSNQDADIFAYAKWNANILDQRVTFLAKALHNCLKKYGYSKTIFGLEEPET
jgi:hypothetical protein